MTRCRASSRMPLVLSPRTFAVVSVGSPASVTIGICRASRSSWCGSISRSCRIRPSLLRASDRIRSPHRWSLTSTERISRSNPDLGDYLDAPVDHVGELQALVLVRQEALADLGGRRPPDDHADDLLQPGGQGTGRAVRGEA